MSTLNPNLNLPKRGALALLLAVACAVDVHAAPGPHGPPGPPGPPPTPSAEELATIPSLSVEQQVQLHKILSERRDAQEAVAKRTRDVLDAQHEKDRAEHERIDEQGSERIRKLLGEEGFRHYAEWQQAHRGPGRDGPGHGGPGPNEGPRGNADVGPDDRPSPGERSSPPERTRLKTPPPAPAANHG